MKKAGLLPLVASGLALACAAAEEPAPRKLSERITKEIRAALPNYTPPAPRVEPLVSTNPPSDADVLVLPNVVVKEKVVPKIEPNDLLSKKDLNRKFAHDYKNSLKGLDAVLNGFWIPLVSPSLASRGRGMFKAQKFDDLNRFIGSTKAADPKGAAKLDQAVTDMLDAEKWQNR